MTVLYPEATQQQGNISALIVQTIANLSAPDLSTELMAGTTVNVSCYLYSGGVGTVTASKGDAPRRLCTKVARQRFGNKTMEITDISYVYDPQAADSTTDNKAKAALTEDTEVYLVLRKGLDAEDEPFAAGQHCEVWKIGLGPQNRGVTGDGEFDEFAIIQAVIARGEPELDAVIVA